MEYNEKYLQIAKKLLQDNKTYMVENKSCLYYYVATNLENNKNFIFDFIKEDNILDMNEHFLAFIKKNQSVIIESEIENPNIVSVIKHYNRLNNIFQLSKPFAKYSFYLDNENKLLCYNGQEAVEFDLNYGEVKLFLIWCYSQTHIELIENAEW